MDMEERAYMGCSATYKISFAIGKEWTAYEDEPMEGYISFQRPDPPVVLDMPEAKGKAMQYGKGN